MKYIIILVILNLIINSCSSNKKETIKHYNLAYEFYNYNKYADALKEIEIAIKLDTTNLDLLLLKSKIKLELELYDDAIEILKNKFPKDYKSDTINYLIGDCFFGLGSYYSYQNKDVFKEKDAYNISIKYFNSTISINPMYFSAYIKKQRAQHNQENYNEALITLNKAITLFPNNMNLIYSRGVEKYFLGDQIQAISDLSLAIDSRVLDSTELSTAYRFRGIIYYRVDSIHKALSDLDNSINLNPTNDLAYAMLADIYRFSGEIEKACYNYRKSAENGNISAYEEIKKYCKEH